GLGAAQPSLPHFLSRIPTRTQSPSSFTCRSAATVADLHPGASTRHLCLPGSTQLALQCPYCESSYTDKDIRHVPLIENIVSIYKGLNAAFSMTARHSVSVASELSNATFAGWTRLPNLNEFSSLVQEMRQGEGYLLIATDIAARGVDLPETTHIYNFDLLRNAVDYLHRAGRAGRKPFSGEKCNVTNIIKPKERFVLQKYEDVLMFNCEEVVV
ncbi:DEAD-box ATP-dependent RNA helicase 58, chloroplastic, partial [Linum perenne]